LNSGRLFRSRGASRLLFAGLLAAVLAAPFVASTGLAATGHRFVASYAGRGNGQINGTTVSGSATLRGHGNVMGAGRLSGSAHGHFVSQACVVFNGSAVLRGKTGSLKLVARGGKACATSTSGNQVSFSGVAKVVGGSGAFADAHGHLAFAGTYNRQSGAVTISMRGELTY
jgi:hypothetical protein